MQLNLKVILGVLGNATAMALFFSPLPTFWNIYKRKSTQEFSGLPYVCTLFNCTLWVLYGMPFVKPNSVLIVTINGFGCALEIFYLTLFLTYASKSIRLQMSRYIVAVVVAYSVVVTITLLALHSLTKRQLVVGCLCVVVTAAMYASPLSIMGIVIRTRSVQYMPFLLSLFNLINSAVWASYSLVTKDIFVAIPNGLGCIFGVAQLVLYAIYRNATPVAAITKDSKASEPMYISMQKSLEEKPPSSKMASPLRALQNIKPLSNCDSLAMQV